MNGTGRDAALPRGKAGEKMGTPPDACEAPDSRTRTQHPASAAGVRSVRGIARSEGPVIWSGNECGRRPRTEERSRLGSADPVNRRGRQRAGLLREGLAPRTQRLGFRVVVDGGGVVVGFQQAPRLRGIRPVLPQMFRFVQGHADGRVEEHGEQQESKKDAAHGGTGGWESYCRELIPNKKPREGGSEKQPHSLFLRSCGLSNALRLCSAFARITQPCAWSLMRPMACMKA